MPTPASRASVASHESVEERTSRAASETGFVLPAALLGLVVLTVLATAGFFTVRQDHRISQSQEHAKDAFFLTELGVAEVLEGWDNATYDALPQWGSLTVVDTTPTGSWSVEIIKANDRLFYLNAASQLTKGGDLLSGASHQIGLAVRMALPDFNPRAAITTTLNVSIRGRASVNGTDSIPSTWDTSLCPDPLEDKAGVMMQDTSTFGAGGKSKVTGVPPLQEDSTIGPSTFTDFGDLQWDELIQLASKVYAGGSLNQFLPQFDGGGNCNRAHIQNWGDPINPASTCGNYFPVIYIGGSTSLQSGSRGQGILLVDGDLAVRGDFLFHGLIIARGAYDAQGSGNRVYGSVMAGNVDFEQQKAVGSSSVQFSKCAVERALLNATELNRARPIWERSWVDLSIVLP
jgi:hypothetical protein